MAFAEIVSPAPEAVEVTIYRARPGLTADIGDMTQKANGLAMITETRTVDIPAGTSTISFRGVAETIVPQSAKLESLPATIVESNFDYSLIGPGELIAKSIGKSVRVVRTDVRTGKITEQRATLLSGPSGVMLDINGKIEALDCSGESEKLVFDSVPAELAEKPTLSATVRTTQAGRYRVRLSYLALGLDWSADYVAIIHKDNRALDLTGWITLANKQKTTFANAPVQVVAGNVSVVEGETVPPNIQALALESKCWPIGSFAMQSVSQSYGPQFAAAPALMMDKLSRNLGEIVVTSQKRAEMSNLGDYKLYSLPFVTTVAAQQIKQVQMIEQKNVPFERVYTYVLQSDEFPNSGEVRRPTITLRLQNKARAGLGKPLPAGTVSVVEHDAKNHLVLAGEHSLEDIPVGLPIDIEIGQAMDIWVQPRTAREYTQERGARSKERADIEVDLVNDKPISIKLELLHRKEEERDFRIVSESKLHTLKYGMPMWTITMQPGERTTLRYTLEQADRYTRLR